VCVLCDERGESVLALSGRLGEDEFGSSALMKDWKA